MSRIYDALEQARKQSAASLESPSPPSISLPDNQDFERFETEMEEEMITLYQGIAAALPAIDRRSVLFVGSRSNEGTSTIARQCARTVSLRLEKSVLLVDLDRSRPDLHVYGGLEPKRDVKEGHQSSSSLEKTLHRVEETSLYVMPLFQTSMLTPRTLEATKEGGFWQPLKERFDLIIVDSPPATKFPDGPGIVSQVDGVVLVVEAEKTGWQVALSVKEKIIKHGGNILGVVFNKRKYYIPQFIYKHL
jgi:protein-tyrosine kinase